MDQHWVIEILIVEWLCVQWCLAYLVPLRVGSTQRVIKGIFVLDLMTSIFILEKLYDFDMQTTRAKQSRMFILFVIFVFLLFLSSICL